MKKALYILALPLILQACFFGRRLEEPVLIRLQYDNVQVTDATTIFSPRYVSNFTMDDYRDKVIEGVRSGLTGDNFIVLDKGDTRVANYSLEITNIEIKEALKTETVSDEDSEFNGQSYELSTCDVTADGTLTDENTGIEVDNFHAYADKNEKVKNNRTLGQLISGSNQSNNVYREKLLNDDVFSDVSLKVGNRLAARVSTKVYKLLK